MDGKNEILISHDVCDHNDDDYCPVCCPNIFTLGCDQCSSCEFYFECENDPSKNYLEQL